MSFPINRMRRLRTSDTIRNMVRETHLHVDDFIYPLFVTFGQEKRIQVSGQTVARDRRDPFAGYSRGPIVWDT